MNRFRLFQIIICFTGVFVLGGVTGWLLKPSVAADAPLVPSERVLEALDAQLKLTPEQKTKLTPLLVDWGRELASAGRGPRKRQQLFAKYVPRVREVLTSAQQFDFDKMVEEHTKRFERRTR